MNKEDNMTVKIEVQATDKELNQAQVHRIKRVANVLREAEFIVDIKWNNVLMDAEKTDQRYIRPTVTYY